MSPKGMRSLRIFTYEDPKTGKEEPAVHFSADNVHLGQVVTHSGQVMGRRNENVKEIERGSKSNHQYILFLAGNSRVTGTNIGWQHHKSNFPGGQLPFRGN
jgi:hypothetical protein